MWLTCQYFPARSTIVTTGGAFAYRETGTHRTLRVTSVPRNMGRVSFITEHCSSKRCHTTASQGFSTKRITQQIQQFNNSNTIPRRHPSGRTWFSGMMWSWYRPVRWPLSPSWPRQHPVGPCISHRARPRLVPAACSGHTRGRLK